MIWSATRTSMLGLSILPILATASVAEPPGDVAERFTMSPVDGGFLRLDKQTGAVAMCAKSGNDWSCKAVEDQTHAVPVDKLSRLESENHDLKARVKQLEAMIESRPPGVPPPPGPLADGPSPDGKVQLPTDEEVDQALDYISRVYKKIREHVRDLDKPLPPDEHGAPPPPPAPPSDAPAPKGSL